MKKYFAILLVAVLMLCAMSLPAYAADAVAYMAFTGADTNDGLTPDTPKKSFGAEYNGVMTLLSDGGTLVVVQKANVGVNFAFPVMKDPLLVTGTYGGVSYVDETMDATTTIGGTFILNGGKTLTIASEVTFDDIILFWRNTTSNVTNISVAKGGKLTITDSVRLIRSTAAEQQPIHLIVEEGATVVLPEAAQEAFTIENLGGTVETYGGGTAATGVELKMTLGKTDYTLNGETKTMDVAPIIRNSRTMLPVRYVAEALGAEIAWDGATSTATLKTADTEIKITVGAATATVNGQSVTLDSPAFIENSRTYMPVRFVAETLGGTVAWDGATSTATITK